MDDIEVLYELADESGDADLEAEIEAIYTASKDSYEKLGILNLLSGEVVTVYFLCCRHFGDVGYFLMIRKIYYTIEIMQTYILVHIFLQAQAHTIHEYYYITT